MGHGRRGWSTRTLFKYAVLQLPGLALLIFILVAVQRWVDLPQWFIWGSPVIWVAKDVILFPLVWRAYDSRAPDAAHTMIGAKGVANERLAPGGYMQVRGELWRAEIGEGERQIEKGETVEVEGIRGRVLLVRPKTE